jgi:Rad3-related DNA helicase
MAGTSEQFKPLVPSLATGDDESWYSVTLQVAAAAARQGRHKFASDLKSVVEASRAPSPVKVTSNLRPKGDVADLATASHPTFGLTYLVLPVELADHVRRLLTEQPQPGDHGFEPAHRLLFEGPPGTGKTMEVAVLAEPG